MGSFTSSATPVGQAGLKVREGAIPNSLTESVRGKSSRFKSPHTIAVAGQEELAACRPASRGEFLPGAKTAAVTGVPLGHGSITRLPVKVPFGQKVTLGAVAGFGIDPVLH